MVIIDTMPATSYKKGRIPGAINSELTVSETEKITPEQKEAFLKALPADKNATIVVYCGFVACQRNHVGATIATEAGYTNVYRQPAGIVGWKDAGYAVESN